MSKDLFITSGHSILNGKGTGAFGVKENGVQFDEAKEARKLVNAIIAHQKRWYGLNSLTDSDTDSLQRVVNKQALVAHANMICLDIHFNASVNSSADGCEVIIDDTYTDEELALAVLVASAIHRALGIPKRTGRLQIPGVKTESETPHKRLAMLSGPTKGINILAEIGFISNPNFIKKYRRNFPLLVQYLSDAVGNFRQS